MNQFPRVSLPGSNNRRVVGQHISPSTSPMTRLVDERGSIQVQAFHNSRDNYLSNLGTGSILNTHHHDFLGSEHTSHPRSTSPCISPPVTRDHSYGPRVETYAFGDRQETRSIVPGIPESAVRPNEVTSRSTTRLEGGRYIHNKVTRKRRRGEERPAFTNTRFSGPHSVQHGSDTDARQLEIECKRRPTNSLQARGTPALLNNYASSLDHEPYQNGVDYERHEQVSCASHHNNLRLNSYTIGDHSPPPRRPNEGTSDALRCAMYLGVHSLTGQVVGDGESPAERVIPVLRRAQILQAPYECPTRQANWICQPSIEFGYVKLTDAEDPGYIDIPGHNDNVLDYEGVGSSILCRLKLSDGRLEKLRISTTNHRSAPEPITKKKLASEIAKLVKRHIETIRAQEGCSGVTFENAMLGKLHHVSRASWQPELWYEVSTTCPNLS